MIITKESVAGTLESSDAMIFVSPSHHDIHIEINSSVGKQFETQIKETTLDVLKQLDISAVSLRLEDKGALDCVLRARLKAALFRASDETINWEQIL